MFFHIEFISGRFAMVMVYSFEMVLVGAILLSAMVVCYVTLKIKRRRQQKEEEEEAWENTKKKEQQQGDSLEPSFSVSEPNTVPDKSVDDDDTDDDTNSNDTNLRFPNR